MMKFLVLLIPTVVLSLDQDVEDQDKKQCKKNAVEQLKDKYIRKTNKKNTEENNIRGVQIDQCNAGLSRCELICKHNANITGKHSNLAVSYRLKDGDKKKFARDAVDNKEKKVISWTCTGGTATLVEASLDLGEDFCVEVADEAKFLEALKNYQDPKDGVELLDCSDEGYVFSKCKLGCSGAKGYALRQGTNPVLVKPNEGIVEFLTSSHICASKLLVGPHSTTR